MPYFKYPTQKPGEKIDLLARRLTCQFLPRPATGAATGAATRDRRRTARRDPHVLLARQAFDELVDLPFGHARISQILASTSCIIRVVE